MPSARLRGTLTVTSGVRHLSGGQTASLAGEREVIQTVVVFADPADYETERMRLLDESRHKSSENVIYLLGRTVSEQQERVTEIYCCSRIVELHRNDPDQEVRDYCASQTERASRPAGRSGIGSNEVCGVCGGRDQDGSAGLCRLVSNERDPAISKGEP